MCYLCGGRILPMAFEEMGAQEVFEQKTGCPAV